MKQYQTPAGVAVVIAGEKQVIASVSSGLELVMSAGYECGAKRIAIAKSAFAEDFFVLSTGMLGEFLQKMVNYGIAVAIFGDYSRYTSKPLRDFIYESNRGRHVCFCSTEEEAVAWLGRVSYRKEDNGAKAGSK